MNGKFAGFFVRVVQAVLVDNPIDAVKKFLVSFEPGAKEELEAVNSDYDLIAYLRERCHLSNFEVFLELLLQHLKLEIFKNEINTFTKERDNFYERILAEDFAKQAIKDHEMSDDQREVRLHNHAYTLQTYYFR